MHFLHRHVLDTVVIMEEGNLPHPRCTWCNILVPRGTLNFRHPDTAQCARGAERKRQRLLETEMRESSEKAFEAYGEPLENVTTFRYLGRVLTEREDDWLAVIGNLGKAWKSWGRFYRILIREGEDPKVSGIFNKTVVQEELLFGSETWVLIPRMELVLDSFQHRVARRITMREPWRRGGWDLAVPASCGGNGGSGI